MAYLQCNQAFGPITLGGIELSAAANEDFVVPDDMIDEVSDLIERSPGRVVTVMGRHTPLDFWIGAVPPWATSSILTNSASAEYLLAFQVKNKITVSRAIIEIGVSSGSVSLGIYTASANTATLIATTGSISAPSQSSSAILNLTSSVTLYPGNLYYQAWAQSNANLTLRMAAANGQIYFGIEPQLSPSGYLAPHLNPGSFPLPNTIDLTACVGTGKAPAIYFLP